MAGGHISQPISQSIKQAAIPAFSSNSEKWAAKQVVQDPPQQTHSDENKRKTKQSLPLGIMPVVSHSEDSFLTLMY